MEGWVADERVGKGSSAKTCATSEAIDENTKLWCYRCIAAGGWNRKLETDGYGTGNSVRRNKDCESSLLTNLFELLSFFCQAKEKTQLLHAAGLRCGHKISLLTIQRLDDVSNRRGRTAIDPSPTLPS